MPSVFAAPYIEELYYQPFKPSPLSTVTLTVGINNSSKVIEKVSLLIMESCENNTCNTQNISMEYLFSCCMDYYTSDISLKSLNATGLIINVQILSDGIWYEEQLDLITLSTKIQMNPHTDLDHSTPGFESLIMILSLLPFLGCRLFKGNKTKTFKRKVKH